MQPEGNKTTFRQRGCGTLFLGFFLLIGCVFVVLMFGAAYKTASTYTWSEAECEILVSEGRVRPGAETEDPPFEFVTHFRYTWQGTEQTSSLYSPGGATFSDWAKLQRLVERYPVGATVSCYVNPASPARAILERQGLWILLWLPLPLVFVLIGGGGIYFLWFGGEKATGRFQALSDRSRVKRRWLGAAVFALFALVGLGLLVGIFLPRATRMLDSQNWTAVPCKVELSRVGVHEGDDSTTYSVDVLYSYEVRGQVYRSSRYGHFNFSSSGYAGKRDIVRSLPRGTETTCYVNPEDPSNAVIDRSPSLGLFLGLLPLSFFLIGLFGLRSQLRKMKRSTVGGIPVPARTTGPLVLEAKVGKWGKFAGALFFAGFWNGIVGVFLHQVFEQWQRGRVEWFLVIFLTPFVLVGLGAIVGIGYYLLALLNPRPRLTLSPGVLRPGSAASLEWELRGNASAVRQVRIRLEGSEQVRVRRGKNSTVRKHELHQEQVFDTGEGMMTPRGTASVKVPREAMHTFECGGAKVTWALHVEGKVARWPDIDIEFPVDVFPAGSIQSPPPEDSDQDPPAIRAQGLSLRLGRAHFAPGTTVDGTADWELAAPPASLELRLFWYLGGQDAKSADVVARQRFDVAGKRGRKAFRLELPPVPHSYKGQRFSIEWAAELVARKPDAVVRAGFTMG